MGKQRNKTTSEKKIANHSNGFSERARVCDGCVFAVASHFSTICFLFFFLPLDEDFHLGV